MLLYDRQGNIQSEKDIIINISWTTCQNDCPGCYVNYLSRMDENQDLPRLQQIKNIKARYIEINTNLSTNNDFTHLMQVPDLQYSRKRFIAPPDIINKAILFNKNYFSTICLSFSPWMTSHINYIFISPIIIDEMEITLNYDCLRNIHRTIMIIEKRMLDIRVREDITLNVLYQGENEFTIEDIFIKLNKIGNSIEYPIRISPCIQSKLNIHPKPCDLYDIIDYVNNIPRAVDCPFKDKICKL